MSWLLSYTLVRGYIVCLHNKLCLILNIIKKQTNERTKRQTYIQTDRKTNKRTNKQVNYDLLDFPSRARNTITHRSEKNEKMFMFLLLSVSVLFYSFSQYHFYLFYSMYYLSNLSQCTFFSIDVLFYQFQSLKHVTNFQYIFLY
jgi:hypothetical protein